MPEKSRFIAVLQPTKYRLVDTKSWPRIVAHARRRLDRFRRSLRVGMLLACSALLIVSGDLRAEVRAAQTVASVDRVVYTTDYAAYSPQTALDMVRRTPGFVLDEGDAGMRG